MKTGIVESKKYVSVPVSTESNTLIGGVAITIPDAATLASKLNILASNISFFNKNGNDIEARIEINYSIPNEAFKDDLNITFYREVNEGKCTNTGERTFWGASNFRVAEFIGDCYINQSAFLETGIKRAIFHGATAMHAFHPFGDGEIEFIYLPEVLSTSSTQLNIFAKAKKVFIPKMNPVGNWQADDGHFNLSPYGVDIWANPVCQTSNSGNEEGDLAYARTKYANIDYSLTSPDFFALPVNFSLDNIGNNFGTSIQLISSNNSANKEVTFTDITVDGISYPDVREGGYITGLSINTTYTISAKIVDEFYNFSESSVAIQVTTETTEPYDVAKLVNYYKLNDTIPAVAKDSIGKDTLINSGITIQQVGLIDKAMQSTNNSNALRSTGSTIISGNFSIVALAYRTGSSTGSNSTFIETGAYPNDGFGIWVNSAGQLSWRVNNNFNHYRTASQLPLNQWVVVTLTYDGSYMRMYFDGVLIFEDAYTGGYTPIDRINMFNRSTSSYIGKIEAASFWKEALTPAQITTIKNRLLSGQHLI